MPNARAAVLFAIVATASLAGCSPSDRADDARPSQATQTRTCDNIRDDVIRIAASNQVNIVKIYEPETLVSRPERIVCRGKALVSSGQQAILYYRNYKDPDGDWLVEYSDNKLD